VKKRRPATSLKLLTDDVGPSAWTAEFRHFQASIGQITFPF
jgi:hypothetical protein